MTNAEALRSMMQEQTEQGNNPPITLDGRNHPLSELASDDGTAEERRQRAADIIVDEIMQHFDIYRIRDDNNKEMWIYKDGVYVEHAQTYLRTYIEKRIQKAYKERFANRVIDRIAAKEKVVIDKDDFFEAKKDRICLENGIYDLSTGELTPHTPDEIHFQKIPVEYKEDAECPKINEFFHNVVETEKDVQSLKEMFAFCLRKEYFLEKAFMLLGEGRNGKSKTLEILRRFLGQENCTNVELQDLDDDNKTIDLQHCLANISADLSSKDLKQTGAFKAATGRDILMCDRKYKSPIRFENYAKMIFSANNLPSTNDLSLAFYDRWIVLNFPYEFVTEEKWNMHTEQERRENNYKLRNPNIVDEVLSDDELSGLFNECVEAYRRLVRKGHFTQSKTAESTRVRWIRQSDSLQAFTLESPFEVAPGRFVTKPDVKEAYQDYCKKHGVTQQRRPHIKSALQDEFNCTEGQKNVGNAKPRVYYGIKFKDEYEAPSGTIDGLSKYQGSLEPSKDKVEQEASEEAIEGNDTSVFDIVDTNRQVRVDDALDVFDEETINRALDADALMEDDGMLQVLSEELLPGEMRR
jgi:P4 family phage/plasmid primase-like protien